jgi:hypothetical protein
VVFPQGRVEARLDDTIWLDISKQAGDSIEKYQADFTNACIALRQAARKSLERDPSGQEVYVVAFDGK